MMRFENDLRIKRNSFIESRTDKDVTISTSRRISLFQKSVLGTKTVRADPRLGPECTDSGHGSVERIFKVVNRRNDTRYSGSKYAQGRANR